MHTDPGKRCDHSVAATLLVDASNCMLLVRRANVPLGYAPPAGHVFDHHNPAEVDYDPMFLLAAINEVREETGLTVQAEHMRLVLDRWSANRCGRHLRPGEKAGHAWRVFEARVFSGVVVTSTAETLDAVWMSPLQVEVLARRTVEFVQGYHSTEDFRRAPGLEPVWVWWFQVLGMLPNISGAEAVQCSNFADGDRHRNS